MNEREIMKVNFKKNIKKIQGMLKLWKYKEQLSHSENMQKLCTGLQGILELDDLSDFHQYLSSQDHLPIEINFKMLRIEHLFQLFEDWLIPRSNTFSILEHSSTPNFRNILFRTIFLDEITTINDYFKTLSQNKRLKGFDLYQLVANLLNHHYLYEFNSDSDTFFQKINSFEAFLQIVNSFIQSKNYFSSSKKKGKQNTIHRDQFELLIQYWEQTNRQLTLLDQPRKNSYDIGVQTTIHNHTSVQVQTNKQNSSSRLSLVNNILHELNIQIERENQPEMLRSLARILDTVRNQKVIIAELQMEIQREREQMQQKHERKIELSRLVYPSRNRSRSPISEAPSKTRNNTPPKSQFERNQLYKTIFDHLCSKSENSTLNSDQLQIFFYHLGLIKVHEGFLLQQLQRNGFIEDSNEISFIQFKRILNQIIIESNNKTNNSTLKKYIDMHIMAVKTNPQTRKPSFQSEYYGLFEKDDSSNTNLDRSKFNNIWEDY